MLGPRSIRRRLFLAILAAALLPAAAALGVGTVLLREAGTSAGTLGPWDAVAASGEALAGEAIRAAPDDAAVARAAEAHRQALSESLRQSQLWGYVSERLLSALPALALASALVVALFAAVAAGLLARGFGRPVAELVGWTERIARAEPLPPAPAQGADAEVEEFARLRDALRRMAGELAEGRRREVEAASLRAWTEMARRVAHDIKNPLMPMQFAARTLSGSPDPHAAEAALVLTEEIGRLDEMARSFAQLGRAPEGPPADVDLEALLRTLASRHANPAHPIEVRAPSTPVPLLHGHLDLLDRVFRNLLVNAVEAYGAGGGPVEVSLGGEDGRVRITVRDHGPGLPELAEGAIWQPNVTTKRGGSGLGLAIVRQGVAAHRGSVQARNAPGGGAEFEVLLPLDGAGPRSEGAWTS